jgi:hypothetical protein
MDKFFEKKNWKILCKSAKNFYFCNEKKKINKYLTNIFLFVATRKKKKTKIDPNCSNSPLATIAEKGEKTESTTGEGQDPMKGRKTLVIKVREGEKG